MQPRNLVCKYPRIMALGKEASETVGAKSFATNCDLQSHFCKEVPLWKNN